MVAVVDSLWMLSACDASALEYRKDSGCGREGELALSTEAEASSRGIAVPRAMVKRPRRAMMQVKDFILLQG